MKTIKLSHETVRIQGEMLIELGQNIPKFFEFCFSDCLQHEFLIFRVVEQTATLSSAAQL